MTRWVGGGTRPRMMGGTWSARWVQALVAAMLREAGDRSRSCGNVDWKSR